MELLWSAVAFAGVVVLGTLKGILVAVITSVAALAHQANNPPVYAVGRKPGTDVFRRRDRGAPRRTRPSRACCCSASRGGSTSATPSGCWT